MVKRRGLCEAFDQDKEGGIGAFDKDKEGGGKEKPHNIIYIYSKKKNELMVVQR